MCVVVTVIFGVCNSVRLSLFVVTLCKCPINSVTNPSLVSSHTQSRDNMYFTEIIRQIVGSVCLDQDEPCGWRILEIRKINEYLDQLSVNFLRKGVYVQKYW
jgi:hypothetical protein